MSPRTRELEKDPGVRFGRSPEPPHRHSPRPPARLEPVRRPGWEEDTNRWAEINIWRGPRACEGARVRAAGYEPGSGEPGSAGASPSRGQFGRAVRRRPVLLGRPQLAVEDVGLAALGLYIDDLIAVTDLAGIAE